MRRFNPLLAVLLLSAAVPALTQTISTFGPLGGVNVWTNSNTFQLGAVLGPVTVSQLPSLAGLSTVIITSDGAPGSSPCTSGGTGALAVYLNGQWACNTAGGLTPTGVTPGTYSCTNLTVGADGRLTFAASSSCGGGGSGTIVGLAVQNNGTTAGIVSSGTPVLNFTSGCTTTFAGSTFAIACSSTPAGNPGAPQFNSVGVLGGQTDIYVGPNFVWSQTTTAALTANTPATVTLTPCPVGINGVDSIGGVYLSGNLSVPDSNPEFVDMTGGGSCVQGNSSGTITFTPLYSHAAGITIGTGSQGWYEAMASVHNFSSAPGSYSDSYRFHLAPAGNNVEDSNNVPYAYAIHGHVNIPGYHVYIDGDGAVLDCYTRDYCVGQYGFGGNGNGYAVLSGMRMEGEIEADGWEIVSTQCSSNVVTINTATTHGIVVGDMVDVQKTDNGFYWGGSVTWHDFSGVSGRVSAVTSTSVSYQVPSGSCGSGIALTNTPGHINILNAAYFDQSSYNEFHRIQLDIGFPTGHFNNGIVAMNDQSMRLYDFISPVLHSNVSTTTCTTSSPYCGWYLYAPGPGSRNSAIADVYNPQFTSQCGGNGIGWFSGNSLRVYSGIMEAQVEVGILTGNVTGGFGQTTITGLYSEPGGCTNPETPGGITANTGLLQYGLNTFLTPGEGPGGFIPTFANLGGTVFYYYIQACDSVAGCSIPMYAGKGYNGTSTLNVFWPRVIQGSGGGTGTLTYNVLRTTNANVAPYYNGCTGGSVNACGLVASGLAQCSGLWCSYTDTLSAATTASSVGGTRGFDTYCPISNFWPGNVVIENNGVYNGNAPATALCFNSSQPTSYGLNMGASGQFGWGLNLGGPATLLNENNNTGGLKGRVNIAPVGNPSGFIQVPLGDYITLSDSNPFKTVNTNTERPAMDAGDVGIGNDVSGALLGSVGLYHRSPTHINDYINCVPGTTGCFFQRQLTSALATTVPPALFQSNVTVLGPTCAGCSPFAPAGTQVSDNCQESNGPLSGNWTVVSGTWEYLNGSCTYTTVDGSSRALALYTNGTFSNDQKAIATLTDTAGSGSMGLAVRGSLSADTAYTVLQQGAVISLFKVIAGTATTLVSSCAPLPSLGQVIGLQAQGTTISVSVQGIQTCSATDSSIASGNPGFFGSGTPSSVTSLNNFFAGNLAYSTSDPLTMPPPTITNESGNAGQAACFATGGVLGHCTSVVSSSGGCTCVTP